MSEDNTEDAKSKAQEFAEWLFKYFDQIVIEQLNPYLIKDITPNEIEISSKLDDN